MTNVERIISRIKDQKTKMAINRIRIEECHESFQALQDLEYDDVWYDDVVKNFEDIMLNVEDFQFDIDALLESLESFKSTR